MIANVRGKTGGSDTDGADHWICIPRNSAVLYSDGLCRERDSLINGGLWGREWGRKQNQTAVTYPVLYIIKYILVSIIRSHSKSLY